MAVPSLGLSLDQARPKQPIKVTGIAPTGCFASELSKVKNGDEFKAYFFTDKIVNLMKYSEKEPSYWCKYDTKEPLYDVTDWNK